MKLAGIIFLIATIVYFLIKWKKTGNESGKPEINKMSGTVKKVNPFKYVFWPLVFIWGVFSKPKKLTMWAILGAIGWGIYLLINYCTPPKSERLFKKIIANQIEVQTKDETGNLEKMAEDSGTSTFSPDELRLAQKNRLDADKKRKKLEAMLEPEKPTKTTSAKPKEETWPWTFEWIRSEDQWEVAKKLGRKKKGEKYPANILKITPNELIMEYVSGYSGKPEKVVLKIGNTGDFYATDYYVKSKKPKEIDLSLKVSLKKDPESPGNFVGTFWQDQDNQQVDCWLSKK